MLSAPTAARQCVIGSHFRNLSIALPLCSNCCHVAFLSVNTQPNSEQYSVFDIPRQRTVVDAPPY